MSRRIRFVLAGVVAACLTLAPATTTAAPPGQAAKLRTAITVQNMRAHEQAFQNIATANGGTRASGTAGYDASVDYVVGQLEAAGYDPADPDVRLPVLPGARDRRTFERTAPTPRTYVPTTEFGTMTYSGSGDVTASRPGGERQPVPARTDAELVERGLRGR